MEKRKPENFLLFQELFFEHICGIRVDAKKMVAQGTSTGAAAAALNAEEIAEESCYKVVVKKSLARRSGNHKGNNLI